MYISKGQVWILTPNNIMHHFCPFHYIVFGLILMILDDYNYMNGSYTKVIYDFDCRLYEQKRRLGKMITLIKAILNIVEIMIIAKITFSVISFFKFGNTRKKGMKFSKRRGILSKLITLAKNPIIYKLEDMIVEQKEKRHLNLEERKAENIAKDNKKVVIFKDFPFRKKA